MPRTTLAGLSMDVNRLIESLARFRAVLPAVVRGISTDDARWRPADGAWTVTEVVCHLCDEEEFDFRARLSQLLADPALPWGPIDPVRWAVDRKYNEQDLTVGVNRFCAQRQQSVVWLRSLDDVDWSLGHDLPQVGRLRAGDLLGSWAAHDQLHLRQIAKRLYQLAKRDSGGYSTDYAGEWRA